MSKAPLIGISGSIERDESRQFIARDYLTAIVDSGGIPLLLSMDMKEDLLKDCLRHLDGLLLAGGGDIDPSFLKELPHPALGEVDPLRDRFEWQLLYTALSSKIPVLGICRGAQVMNAVAGGSLYQDIETQALLEPEFSPILHHQTAPGKYPCHEIHLEPGSLLYAIFSTPTLAVNSFHHQGIKKAAPGLQACAHAPDGLIEAIEDPNHPFWVGVQWHPERMKEPESRSKRLFDAFVHAATRHAE